MKTLQLFSITLVALAVPYLAASQPPHSNGNLELCSALKSDQKQLSQDAETLKFGLKRELPSLIDFGRRISASKPDPETKKFATYAADTASDALSQAAKLEVDTTSAFERSEQTLKAFCGG